MQMDYEIFRILGGAVVLFFGTGLLLYFLGKRLGG